MNMNKEKMNEVEQEKFMNEMDKHVMAIAQLLHNIKSPFTGYSLVSRDGGSKLTFAMGFDEHAQELEAMLVRKKAETSSDEQLKMNGNHSGSSLVDRIDDIKSEKEWVSKYGQGGKC